jgi:hypothetical protein
MNLVAHTTRYSPERKSYSWSYSKLKNFELCPLKHYHVDFLPKGHADKIVEPESEQIKWGNVVHKVLAQRIAHGTILPPVHATDLEPWALKVTKGAGTTLVEQQLAINEALQPCEWFGNDAWVRVKADVIKLNGPVGMVIDWKTGRILEDHAQLALTAAVMFAHYPDLKVIASLYVWLKENAETKLVVKREQLPQIWAALWPRMEALKHAYQTLTFPPTPNYTCRYCPVKKCPHNENS